MANNRTRVWAAWRQAGLSALDIKAALILLELRDLEAALAYLDYATHERGNDVVYQRR